MSNSELDDSNYMKNGDQQALPKYCDVSYFSGPFNMMAKMYFWTKKMLVGLTIKAIGTLHVSI